MEDSYDFIVLGTGLKESILSGLLSANGYKVLHMDKNNYYGGESASLNLEDLYKKFKGGQTPPPELGKSRSYCVDLCPKFLMASGDLVKVLISTKVTRYLSFKVVAGSYVGSGDGSLDKVPATASEALSSSLLGFFEKRRFKNFLDYVAAYDINNPKTHKSYDLTKMTCKELFDAYSLSDNTANFTGHAIALYNEDSYLSRPALEAVQKCQIYARSVARYGSSPFIYPEYGLGGLPEGFSRLSAVYGGIYMLNTEVEEIVYGDDKKVVGVKSGGKIAKCKAVLGDPSYFLKTDKVKKNGSIIRCIVILPHPIPKANGADSCQIVVTASSCKRKNDIYIAMTSEAQKTVPAGFYLAVISTVLESASPNDAFKEIKPAIDLLGKASPKWTIFCWVSDRLVPTDDGTKDNVFVTASMDESTHFEEATKEVMELFPRITGKKLDLTKIGNIEDEDE